MINDDGDNGDDGDDSLPTTLKHEHRRKAERTTANFLLKTEMDN
jgi:hypothetical protein